MSNLKIPLDFLKKIEENQAIDGIVKTIITEYGGILEYNEFYFFRGYTDHSIKHIENVLASSNKLILDGTFKNVLTYTDLAYYILVVILHDLGMHISLEGFNQLIGGVFDATRIKEIDKLTWREMWDEFISESKKFSGKQLKAIFGDENYVVRNPILSSGEINENDKKLIGEFLRRNHPRLAHEIALIGFPGVNSVLPFAPQLGLEIRNLLGLIARSHGIALRTSVDYLEAFFGRYNKRNPFNTHAVFLMVLLRIADYIQIDSGRTSRTILKLKSLSSSASEREHGAHLAIDYIDDKYQDDPERIYVKASPEDSVMYLKLKDLFKNIQFEFDISWAVLGEIYGHIEERPEIKYRRITSNLDEEDFILRQEYLADSCSFKANDEIIKLLIAPLYGDDPKYGVRELLQNAVDACNERAELEKRQNSEYQSKIRIEIIKENNESYFKIIDNGIGMDDKVIKDYLLSAGASYRKSSEWQREFLDTDGNVIVRRSGRFGIGILAAFLIGKEILVETKKVGQVFGYRFHANLNSEQINILKDISISEGTTIKIRIDDKALKKLEPDYHDHYKLQWFHWYTLKRPAIEYIWFGKQINLYKFNPDINEPLPKEWNAIDSEGFNKILWTYSNKYSQYATVCNGIVIPNLNAHIEVLKLPLILSKPRLNVFDNNGFLPLSLDRNSFSDRIPFEKELAIDIYKDFIAYILVFDRLSIPSEDSIIVSDNKVNHPAHLAAVDYSFFHHGFNIYEKTNDWRWIMPYMLNRILVSKNGFILNYNYFIQRLGAVNAVFIQAEDEFETLQNRIHLDIKDRFLFFTTDKIKSIWDYVHALEPKQFNHKDGKFQEFKTRAFLKSTKYDYLFEPTKKRVSKWLRTQYELEFENKGWTCIKIGNPNPSIVPQSFLNEYSSKLNFIREYEIKCYSEGISLFDNLLHRYIGADVTIPFLLDERKEKYPLAFQELESYIIKYSS